MRGLPRWLMLMVWAVFLPAVYAGLPYLFSLSSRGYGWKVGHPTLVNDMGLVIVIAGLAIVTWVIHEHYRNFPRQGRALEILLEGRAMCSPRAQMVSVAIRCISVPF